MTNVSHQGALKGTPLYDIAKSVQKADTKGKVIKTSPSIVKGLTPKKPPLQEGLRIFGPPELASVLVPRQELTEQGTISGFQRDTRKPHVRRIGEALDRGELQPVLELALYRNALWYVDGQHRALGAILANEELPVVIRKMTAEEMRKLFASQQKAMRINASILVLSADDPYAEYVQDAVTASSPKDNPWFGMVTHQTSSTKRINPNQMYEALARYVGSSVSSQTQGIIRTHEFKRNMADELALLFKAFGSKSVNPLPFRPSAIRGIVYAAIFIIRRRGSKAQDIKRWQTHMTTFPWEQYVTLRKSKEIASVLIRHWNKRLAAENRVPVPDEIM